jgi:uroporphyrinogen-III decarboxylase
MYTKLIGRTPDGYNSRDAVDCALTLEHDAVWIPFGGFSGASPTIVSDNSYVDEWGTTMQTGEESWPIDAPIDYPIKSRDDLKGYTPPDPTLPGRDEQIIEAVKNNSAELAITGGVAGPLCQTWMLMGYENICYALYDDPDMVEECFKISNEYNMEAARRCAAAGCDAMWISEDLGDSNAGFMSNDHFRKHLLPYIAELAEYIDSLGMPVLLHSCGQIMQYTEELAQTKIASLHPLQRTANMDIKEVKEKYGHRFSIIGNVDSSRTLPFGTPEDIIAETKEVIDAAGPTGLVLASDRSLHDGIPIENIIALRDAGLKYGKIE